MEVFSVELEQLEVEEGKGYLCPTQRESLLH
jgi:hypothetical protein